MTNDFDSRIVELYSKGLSSKQIIAELGLNCSAKDVLATLRFLGVEIRPRGTHYKEKPCVACGQALGPRAANVTLCKTCAPNKEWVARYYNYKLTKTEFDAMREKQSNLCDLCELPLPNDVCNIIIDHCHKQGHVRALLHQKCNIGLHYIENDKFLANAVRYIERHRK